MAKLRPGGHSLKWLYMAGDSNRKGSKDKEFTGLSL